MTTNTAFHVTLDHDLPDMVIVQPGQHLVRVNYEQRTVECHEYTGLNPLCTRNTSAVLVTPFNSRYEAEMFRQHQIAELERPRVARASGICAWIAGRRK